MSQTTASGYSRAAKARWDNPTKRAEWLAALRDPTTRVKMSEASKARWADPAMREKIIAAMKAAAKSRRKRDTADG